jgi:hypothetical protein
MDQKSIQEQINNMRKVAAKASESKASAIAFLEKAGIYTEDRGKSEIKTVSKKQKTSAR